MPGRFTIRSATLVLAVALLAACTSPAEPQDANSSAPQGAAGSGSVAPRSSSVPSAPLPVLASRETSTTQSGDAVPLRVEINELVRRGDLLLLNLTLLNVSSDVDVTQVGDLFDDRNLSQLPSRQSDADGISLVDTANSKRHLVARDSEGECVCTRGLTGTSLAAGQPVGITATFAAPPKGTETMDVLVPDVGTFPAVPIS